MRETSVSCKAWNVVNATGVAEAGVGHIDDDHQVAAGHRADRLESAHWPPSLFGKNELLMALSFFAGVESHG